MRTLRIAIRALIVATVVIFLVSAYNVAIFFGGMISPGSGIGLKLTQTQGTGDYVLSLGLNPTNRGFLGVNLSTRLTIFDAAGKSDRLELHIYRHPSGAKQNLPH